MKILVVCQYYFPENFQITPICEQLVADGHEVTVVTGLPNYPTGIIPEEYKKGHRDEKVNGVHVIRCHEVGRKKGAAYLALNYFSYVRSASAMVKKLKDDFDVVFVYQLSPVLMGLPAIKYAKKNKKPLFLYCCDLWPESMKMYIQNESNPAFKWAKGVSKKVYTAADKIACQSTSFIPYLKKTHDIPDNKLVYIPAFADETYLSQDFTPEGDTVDFVFLGNLGIAQNLIAVLKAVEKIKNVPNFMMHFVGDGSVLDEMKKFVLDHGLETVVTFYGRRPVDDMPKFYKLADACLVSLQADNQIGLTLPGKVQGYMAAGKPIIGMIDGSAKDVIDESECGICVKAGDVDALAEAMKDFIENRDKYKGCGEKARDYFKSNFRKSIFMGKLESELERLGNR
jgi:glycosyltransferase involved in cell wall biosynthesis